MSTGPRRALLTLLDRVRVAPRQTTGSLTIWPLVRESLGPRQGGPRIATLAQALEDGFVSVEEGSAIHDGGRVSAVRIGNRACDPVLIVFSEELHAESGALIADESVLLPPASELEVCVHSSVESAHCAAGAAESGAFPLLEGQVGFVAALEAEIVGLEVMADAEIFARSFEILLRPHILAARDVEVAGGSSDAVLDPLFDSPEAFLAALLESQAVASPTAGLGRGLRLAGPGLVGCALEAGQIVHLSASPVEVAWAA